MLILVSCSGQKLTGRGPEALAKAEEFFAEFAAGGGPVAKGWDLSELRVFGRDPRFGWMGAGQPAVVVRPDAPDTFEVTIPFWCAGVTKQGDEVKRQLNLAIQLAGEKSGFTVKHYEFRAQESLGFWHQLFAWMGWGFLLSLLFIGLPIGILGTVIGQKAASVLSALLALPLAGYVASVVFGSTFAVVVCVCLAAVGALLAIVAVANS
jgi:hypothetical protein